MGGEVPDDRKRPTRSTKRNKAPSRCKIFELWAATRTAESRNRVAEGRTEQWIYNRGYERCSRGICQLLQIEIQRQRCLRSQRKEDEEERIGDERSEEERLAP